MLYLFDIIGTFAFAVSGAFRAVKYELDLLGVLALALVTGVAGGVIRDVILGATPPTVFVDHWYAVTCVLAGVCVFFAAPKIATRWNWLMLADAVGLGVFAVIGASKAEVYHSTPFTVLFMAVLTACGGGILRDVLTKEIPSVLKSDFYASAAFVGGVTYVLLGYCDVVSADTRTVVTVIVTLVLRLLAMKYGIGLPKVRSLHMSPSQIARQRKKKS